MTTPQFRPQSPIPPGPNQYGPPFAPPGYHVAPKKKSKAPLVLGILAGVFVLFFGGCMALVAAVGSGVNEAAKKLESSVQAAAPTVPGAATAPAPESALAPAAAAAGIGAPVMDGKFEFTVTKVEPGPARIGNKYFGQDAQGKFVLVHVTVTNIGNVAQTFFDANQKLFDAQGRQFSADSAAAIYLDNSQSFLTEINPGNQHNGIVVFDVPKDAQPTRIELYDSAFSGGVTVVLG